MPCPLCPPVSGMKKLRYEDNRVWVAEIEGIGCPVIALKRHNGIPTEEELRHVRMVLENLGMWDPSRYSEGTSNPGHYHVYLRAKPRGKPAIRQRHPNEGVVAESL